MIENLKKILASVLVVCLFFSPSFSFAGTLQFDGVPVDITTTDGENLIIVPGTGGNTQIGDKSGTNSNATANDDLYITGNLEVDGTIYADFGMISASHVVPDVDSINDLGSATKYWRNLYVDNIIGPTVFNDDGADVDFRIEGDNQASLLYTDAGTDKVGFSGVLYAFPSSQGAATTYLRNDGSGNLSWATLSSSLSLSSLTAASAANSVNNGDFAQVWNWSLTTADKVGFKFGENTASTASGSPAILQASTVASSTAMPLYLVNLGNGASFRVDDAATDTTPFIVNDSGNTGIGDATPSALLSVGDGDLFTVSSAGAVQTGANGQDGQLVMYSEQGATDYSNTFNPHTTMTQNVTYTLPADDGAANQFLRTDGSGSLSWAGVSSTTLQGAYDATSGNTITTTTARDFDLVLDNTATDSNLDININPGSTSTVSISLEDGANTTTPTQLLLLENLDTTEAQGAGILFNAAAGGMTTAIDATDAEIGTALSVAANDIVGTTGLINFTNFDVSATGGITTGANGQSGGLTIYSEQGGTDYSVIFQPGTMTQSTTYTLPTAYASSNGQVLASTTAGALSWATAASGTITAVGDVASGAAFTQSAGADGNVLSFEGAGAADAFEINLTGATNTTADYTLTLPAATDTLVGKATTDTLTNKTLVTPVLGAATYTTLSGGAVTDSSLTATRVQFSGTAGLSADDAGLTFTAASDELLLGAAGTDGSLKIYSEDGATDHSTIFNPGIQTQDVVYTLPVDDGTANQVLQSDGAGVLSWATAAVGDITAVGDVASGAAFTQSAGADGNVLSFEGAGAADAFEINLTGATNTTADYTLTLPAATDTLVGKATTDTLTNKTFDTAGTGNSFSINGVAATANTGTGAVVRATSPTLVTPVLGAATYTTLSGGAVTDSSLTATRVQFSGTAGLSADDAGLTFTAASDELLLGAAGTDGSLKIYSEDGATDHSTIFNPGVQTQDVVYTLPVDDGTANQVLQSDGAGVLSWATAGAGDITAVGDVASGAAFTQSAGADGNVLSFEGAGAADAFEINLTGATNTTADYTLTLPAATDTLVGKATTDTLTNKTLVTPVLGAATYTTLSGGAVTDSSLTATRVQFSGTAGLSADDAGLTFTAASDELLLGAAGTDGSLKIYSEDGATDHSTIFNPGVQTQDVVYTLPVDDGTANQVLQSDGAGVLSWATAGAGDITAVGDVASGAAFTQSAGADGNVLSFEGAGAADAFEINLTGATNTTADYTLTLPAATDTLVGKATTDTLTNKTLVTPVLGAATYTTLSGGAVTDSSLTATRVQFSGTAGLSADDAGLTFTAASDELLLGAAGTDGSLKIYSEDGATDHSTIFNPGVQTQDVVYTLPVDDGTANQVLQSDGAGVLSWATAGAGDITAVGDVASGAAFTQSAGADGNVLSFEGAGAADAFEINLTGATNTTADYTLTLPAATDTLVGKATTDTLTNKTLVTPVLGAATYTTLSGGAVTDSSLTATRVQFSGTAGLSADDAGLTFTAASDELLLGAAGTDGSLKIYSEDGATDHSTIFNPGVQTQDVVYTLPVDDGTANQVLQSDGAGVLSWATAGAGDITAVGDVASGAAFTQSAGADGNVLSFEGAGAADAFEINLTGATNTTADYTLTLPAATDTLVGKATTDTLTNKTLVTPVLGAATYTTLSGGAVTDSSLTATRVQFSGTAGLSADDAGLTFTAASDELLLGAAGTDGSLKIYSEDGATDHSTIFNPGVQTQDVVYTLPVDDGTANQVLQSDGAGVLSWATAGAGDITAVGDVASGAAFTQSAGADGNVLSFEGAGAADAFEINLTGATNTTADYTLTLPAATDTLVGKATTDTLTNKTLVTPVLGAATYTTLSGGAVTDSSLTATRVQFSGTAGLSADDAGLTFTAASDELLLGAAGTDGSLKIYSEDGATDHSTIFNPGVQTQDVVYTLPVDDGTANQVLQSDGAGVLSWATAGAGDITAVGDVASGAAFTQSAGADGNVLSFEGAGAADAFEINLTGATNTTADYTLTLPAATDTLVGKATTDTLTNKTFDTAGTGNSFSINGVAATANTGTGAVVRATSPTLVTPVLGAATYTTLSGGAVTDSSLTATRVQFSGTAGLSADDAGLTFTAASDELLLGAAGTDGSLKIYSEDGATDHSTIFNPGIQTQDVVYTLPVDDGTANQVLQSDGAGVLSWATAGAGDITAVGDVASGAAFTQSAGADGNVLSFEGAGAADAFEINLTGATNTTADYTLTLPAATDTLVGKATTDTLTNKTFDTAGTGNSFSINGVAATANTGTGAVVRATSPTLVTPVLGAATYTTLSGGAVTDSSLTATRVQFSGTAGLSADDAGLTFTAASDELLLGAAGTDGSLKIYSEDGATDHSTIFNPGIQTQDVVYTLPVDDGTANQVLQSDGAGVLSWATAAVGDITAVGDVASGAAFTQSAGADGNVLSFEGAGAADAFEINLTGATNTTADYTLTLPAATDTLVGKATTDTLTNKTFDTAGTGNSFSINGVAATANTGTGAVVRATSPTLVTPVLGAATYTTLSGGAVTDSSLTATRVQFSGTAGLSADDAGLTFTAASDELLLGAAGTDGSLKIYSEDGATDHSTIFNPGIQTQDVVYTLPVDDGTANQVLQSDGAGVLSWATAAVGDITAVGDVASGAAFTQSAGADGNVLSFEGAGAADAFEINLTGATNTTADYTLTLPAATDTLVGKATTDTLTNKTFDTAGTGNSFSINGVAATANTGTGAVVRATSPTLVTPVLGAATYTTLSGGAVTDSSLTATRVQFSGTAGLSADDAGLTFTAASDELLLGAAGTDGSLKIYSEDGATDHSTIFNPGVQTQDVVYTLPVDDGTANQVLQSDGAGVLSWATAAVGDITAVGDVASGAAFTQSAGADGNVLSFEGAGAADAFEINLTGATNTTADYTLTLPAATDTLVGKATTDTLTNKTFDTAGTGNSFSINGVAATANTGTGAVVRATSPTLVTPVLGAATYTTLSGGAVTDSSLTATRVQFSGTAGLSADDAGLTFTAASDELLLGAAGTDGSLKIYSEDGATDHSTIFNPGIQTQDVVYTLPVDDGTANQVLQSDGAGVLSWATAGAGDITAVGDVASGAAFTQSAGADGNVLSFEGAGAADAFEINLTGATNTTADYTLTLPAATDTLVGKATTDTLTNKTFDTAGTGNSFSINGVAATANTGTGAVVRATSPTLVTPVLGAATYTTLSGGAVTDSSLTATRVQFSGTAGLSADDAGLTFTAASDELLLGAAGTDGSLKIYSEDGATDHSTIFNPGIQTQDVVYTLPVDDGTANQVLQSDGAGVLSWATAAVGDITAVGDVASGAAFTQSAGADGNVLSFEGAGAADAFEINLTGATNTTADYTLTLPAATDTLVGKATTDTLTNKTFDTAGTGNSFSINGVAATANTGTGAVVRATSPTLVTPVLGAATYTTLSGGAVTDSSLTATRVQFSGTAGLSADDAGLTFTAASDELLLGAAGTDGSLKIYSEDGATDHSTIFNPGIQTQDVVYTLPVDDGTANQVLQSDGAGVLSWATAAVGDITAVGDVASGAAFTQSAGADGNVLSFEGAGAADAFEINLTGATNTTADYTLTLPAATDTLVGKATTDTLTNKTFDTAGTGNSFSINGVAATANTGTGAVVRATSPTLVTPVLGAATYTTLSGGAVTDSSLTATRVQFSGTAGLSADDAGLTFTAASDELLLGAAGTDGSLKIYSEDGATDHSTIFNPGIQTQDVVYTLPVDDGTANQVLQSDGAGVLSWATAAVGDITAVGDVASGAAFTQSAGADGNVLSFEGAGAADAFEINLTGATNTTADYTLTLPAATDTLVGKATTDTLTNKTFDTAGTGNSFSINGVAATANTGTGAVVRATSPTLVTPVLGAATYTTLSGGAVTDSSLTATRVQFSGTAGLSADDAGLTFTAASDELLLGAAGTDGSLKIYSEDGATDHSTIFNPGIQTQDVVYTLPVDDGTANQVLQSDGAGVLSWATAGAGDITAVGDVASGAAFTQSAGADGNVLSFEGAGAADAFEINLTGATNTTADYTLTLPAATDTLVGKATTDTLTNKTFDTAGTGNSFSINGVAATANTGTGAVVRATSPTLVTPVLGAATYTTLSGGAVTDSSLTATRVQFSGTAGLSADDAGLTFTAASDELLLGAAGTDGSLKIYSEDGATDHSTIFNPGIQTQDVVYTLPVDDGTANQVLQSDGAGVLSWATAGAGDITAVGDVASGAAFTQSAGADGNVLSFEGAGAADAFEINLTGATNTTADYTLTLPAATDTLVGKATTDTLTNKTFDTAGTGNSFSINGVAATANTGTGAVVRATSPTLVTPVLGAATYTTLSGGAVTDSSLTATRVQFSGTAGLSADDAGLTFTAASDELLLGAAGTDGSLKIYSEDGATDHSTIFNPGIQTQDVVYTLPVDDGTANQVLQSDGAGVLSWATAAVGDITAVGDVASGAAFTQSAGADGNVLSFEGAGAADAFEINLTGATNTTADYTLTLPAATDTLVGKATTDTLTNKTFDTAGTGNSFSINGVAATANTGTGAVVRATSPTLVTPVLGAATYTTLSGGAVTDSSLTATRVQFSGTAGLSADDAGLTFTAASDELLLGAAGTDGSLKIYSEDGATDHSTIFNPGVQTQDVVYTLPVDDGTANQVLQSDGAGVLSWATAAVGDITAVGDVASGAAFTQSAGADGNVLSFEGAGAADAFEINLTGATNTTADYTLTLPAATDTLVGKATTDTLTNKTFDTAGTGNSFSINGVAATANTGTGAVVRATSPTLVTPVLGAATYTTLSGGAVTDSSLTATRVQFSGTAGLSADDAGLTFTAASDELLLGAAGTDGSLKIYSEDGATDHSTIFNPGVQTQDVVYTLPVDDGTANQVLQSDGAGVLSWATAAVGDITAVGDVASGAAFTQSAGADGNVLSFEGAGAADAFEINLTGATNTTADYTLTLPAATDTLVGKATTDTLTNKTFDTAGTGNSFSINGVAATANTGTGAVVRATSPTFVTPTLGVASATSINKVAITAPATASTLTIADGVTLTASANATLNQSVATTSSPTFANLTLTGTVVSTPDTTTTVANGAAITVTKAIMKIQGTSGAADLGGPPQIVDGSDGQMVTFIGKDNTNNVLFENGNGLKLREGVKFRLGQGDILVLIYDATDDLWTETSRQDNVIN